MTLSSVFITVVSITSGITIAQDTATQKGSTNI